MIAALVGFLIGGLPTADWIARLRGVDLRNGGSGNPGANNARRLGGVTLGLAILAVEVSKGTITVLASEALWGPDRAVAAGVGAVAGNVFNPYRRLRGGQGLGITLGVLLGAWPAAAPIALVVIAGVAFATKRAPGAALAALACLLVGSVAWNVWDLPIPWGVDGALLVWLAGGIGLVVAPKQVGNLLRDRRRRVSHAPA